ncbi:MAG: SAM-dependent methyltransferase [Phascolarctobacterium sp.]|nr:SAM-dependent methyltransferase [Candidatus Phascolarctobacterium caballi]
MKLDKRLSAIVKYVPDGAKVADIGTDHAYLPTVLLLEKTIPFAVVSDVAAKPCKMAWNTLAMYGLTKVSAVRQGDGLSVIQPKECDCLVFAGMGGITIIDILQNGYEVAQSAKRLIFQPMQGADRLREYLCKNNFSIVIEDLVEDGKYLYDVIVAEPKEGKTYTQAEYIIGGWLLEHGHSLLPKQFAKQKGIYKRILDGLKKSKEMVNSDKFKEIQQVIYELEELEHEYC